MQHQSTQFQVTRCAAALASFLVLQSTALAASLGSSDKPWLIPPHILEFAGTVSQLFGTNSGFGARVLISEVDAPKNTKPAGGLLLFRDGDTIFQPDSAPIKAPKIRKRSQDGDFGLLVVTRRDKALSYVVSEGVSGYTEIKHPTPTAIPMQLTDAGRERVQGYDCVKKQVTLTPASGDAQSYVVWLATRMRDFPVKIERRSGGPAVVFAFSDIRFERPNDALFAKPEGYHAYESLNAMTEEMTRRVWNIIRRPEPSIAFPASPNLPSARGATY